MRQIDAGPGPVEGEVVILVSRFNERVTDGLLRGALKTLAGQGVANEQVQVVWVPGAFELPLLAQHHAARDECVAVIALGAVIKGETAHFEYISDHCAAGLSQVALKHNKPVAFGVLTCYSADQALARCADDEHNKGREAALAALETARTLAQG